MFISTGYPIALLDNGAFQNMLQKLDPKFIAPGSATLNKHMNEVYTSRCAKLKQLLSDAQRVTICIDGWTKKGLAVSFIGISACFFNTHSNKACHAFLNLTELSHPHTGEALFNCLQESLNQWAIPTSKVMLIVSDSGANIVKAIKLLQSKVRASTAADFHKDEIVDDESDSENDDPDEESTESIANDEEANAEEMPLTLPDHVPLRHMACMAHSIQLLLKRPYRHYETLITKTRSLVGKIRKSSITCEKLVEKCGKTVVTDCTTRWNSTYMMITRLLQIKSTVEEVLSEAGKHKVSSLLKVSVV